jgi:hypothetical protein
MPAKLKSIANREHVIRAYATFSAIMYRIVPVIIFGLLFTQVAVLIDQKHYREAPATDFLQYTDFTVNNARVGEDVYFKVCRQHVTNIRYSGDLNIYIIANPDQSSEKRVKVYGRDIGGVIDNDCENKVIRASDFKHDAGTYEMSFCVDFKVKYGYGKEICKTSNRYRIYPQPTDLESQINALKQQLDAAQAQLEATQGNINQPNDKSTALPQNGPADSSTPPNRGTTTPTGSGNGNTGTGTNPPTCAINIGSLGLACGGDGLLRL